MIRFLIAIWAALGGGLGALVGYAISAGNNKIAVGVFAGLGAMFGVWVGRMFNPPDDDGE